MSLLSDFPRGTGNDGKTAPLATARWHDRVSPWQSGSIWLGRDGDGRAIGHGDDRHAVLIAGSRSGKGRSAIIPNLFLWPGSCLVINPKGENASVTAASRAARPGHRVAVLDPRGAANVPDFSRVSFNPLGMIDAGHDDAIDLAAAIGEALMIGSGDGKDIHWNESARSLFEAVLLHVAVTQNGASRSLVKVRQYLTLGDPEYAETLNAAERAAKGEKAEEVSPFDALWTAMADSKAANPAVRDVIRGAAHTMNGYWVFQAPVGYKYEKVAGHGKMLVRNEPLASIVAEALDGYASGRFQTQAEVMRWLEHQPAYPKDKAASVRNQRVSDILNRVVYAGYIDLPDWKVSLVPAKHEALISYEAYQTI